jgi:hypothetical protein
LNSFQSGDLLFVGGCLRKSVTGCSPVQSPSSLSQSSVITSCWGASADEGVKFDTVEETLGDFRLISLGMDFFFAIVPLEGGGGAGSKFIACLDIAFVEEQDMHNLPAPSISSAKHVTCKPILQREHL